jgi:hypothetical protein
MKFLISLLIGLFFLPGAVAGETPEDRSIREESLQTLAVLTDALLSTQIQVPGHKDEGALVCPENGDLHTRAAEAVYPLAVMFAQTRDRRYLRAGKALGNWLIRQQGGEGEWQETPWTWTGTTADQLLMMALSYPILEKHLDRTEQLAWKKSIRGAAAYLVKRMSPDFATINYCATTPAALAAVNRIMPDSVYVIKAGILARQVLAKMNTDGFIEGEAARVGTVKYGVDPGYEMDMSFWGLLFYARLTDDRLVAEEVRHAVAEHLPLVYPNGMIDGSWGARCYKWTTYGSKTADGSQILFSLLAQEDPRYRTAALRNLAYLRSMIRDGLVGNGPQLLSPGKPPCIYPTFARAKNLALAVAWGDSSTGPLAPLPSDSPGMFHFFPSVHIALARTELLMATISGYQYIDQQNWGEGRYGQFPAGGSLCNLWIKEYGLLQTSSPTRYIRGEIIHMPEINEPIKPHTPRIEFSDSSGYWTNLYDRFGSMRAVQLDAGHVQVSYAGELRNAQHLPGGVSFRYTHLIKDSSVTKCVECAYHDARPEIQIVEPLVWQPDMEVVMREDRSVRICARNREFLFQLLEGDAEIVLGEERELCWQPFPELRTFPIILKIARPENPFVHDNYKTRIRYTLQIQTPPQ